MVVEGRPATLARSLALGLEGVDDEDIVLLGFPDSVWEPLDGYAPLVGAVGSGEWEAALGLFPAPDPEACDVVATDREGRVVGIEVKSAAPSSKVIWGCAAARAGTFAASGMPRTPASISTGLRRIGRCSECGS